MTIQDLKRLIRESILQEMDIPKGVLKLMGSMRKKGTSFKGKELDKVLAILGGWSIDELEDPKDPKKTILVVKSPSGKMFEPRLSNFNRNSKWEDSITANQFLDNYPSLLRNNGQKMTDWLYNDTEFLDQINAKLGMEPYLTGDDKKRAKEKAGIDMGVLGTCPCCFGTFKLSLKGSRKGSDKTMPGMVLHGYKRPGRGYVQGECPGVGWAPFELSKEGTEYYLKRLKGYLSIIQKQFEDSQDEAKKRELKYEISAVTKSISTLEEKIAEWSPEKIDNLSKT